MIVTAIDFILDGWVFFIHCGSVRAPSAFFLGVGALVNTAPLVGVGKVQDCLCFGDLNYGGKILLSEPGDSWS